MPSPITSEPARLDACTRCNFKYFYFALLPFALHWSLVVFINSSYLQQFFTSQMVSALYISGALITLVSFLVITRLFNHFGNIHLTICLTIIEFIALIGMALFPSPYIALTLFIIHQAIVPLILFTLDTLLEGLIGSDESATGGRRGIFLTIGALTGALATLIMGFLMGNAEPQYALVYILSALLLIPFLAILLQNFSAYKDSEYIPYKAFAQIQNLWYMSDIRNVFFAHFLLQIFFAWMIIYTPIYLVTKIGYSWEQVGLILFTGLMAYVFLEYLIGYLADTYFGEKEMMALGFAIIAISVSWFVFLDGSSIIDWMLVMFMTRVGASFVETTTESYFFKHTQNKDASIIGMFRIAQPLGFIIGPVLGGILLFFFPFSFIFVILSILMIPGLFFAMALHDTK